MTVGDEVHMANEYTGFYGLTPVTIVRSSMFEDMASDGKSGKIKLLLPAGFKCSRIQGVIHSPSTPAEVGFISKMAHENSGDWIKGWSIDSGRTVCLDMPLPVKVAYQKVLDQNETGLKLDRLMPKHAEFVLAAAGVLPKHAIEFVKSAQADPITAFGIHYRPAELRPEPSKEAAAQESLERQKLADSIQNKLHELKIAGAELYKLAAILTDKKTVDAVLGLGLANEHNVDDLIDAIPRYEEIVQELAVMLKDARISGGPVHEQAIQKAMIAVENFLEQAESYVAALQKIRSINAAVPPAA
jgi:hypothetical protein